MVGSRNRKAGKKGALSFYTLGEMNRILDSIIHPFFRKSKGMVFLDGFFHALLEQNGPESAMKFVKYSLPQLLQQTGKKRKVRRRRSRS